MLQYLLVDLEFELYNEFSLQVPPEKRMNATRLAGQISLKVAPK